MGWTYMPPSSGDEFTAYDKITELWKAVRQRERALGVNRWPPTYNPYNTGTVEAITDNGDGTITVDCGAALNGMQPHSGGGPEYKRWVGWSDPDAPWLAYNYDLIIECNGPDDHKKIIHVEIWDNDEETLTVPTWIDWVTAGWIDSLSDAVGATYFIIKRGGWWHHERWPVWPNAQEKAKGTCEGDTVVIDGTTYSRITDQSIIDQSKRRWPTDLFAGADLVVRGDDSRLHRVSVIGNDGNTLWYALDEDWTADGAYCVVAADAQAWPGRTRFGIFQWYGGYTKAVYTHGPNDNLGTAEIYTDTVPWDEYNTDIEACEVVNHTGYGDVDAWSAFTNECDPHEYNFSRWIFATLRGLQAWVEQRCSQFVPMDSYDGEDYIANFTFPELMHRIGINSATASVSGPNGSNQYTIAVDSAYEGATVYYSIRGATGTSLKNSSGTVSSGTLVVGTHPTDASIAGLTAVYTAGWTRWMPRMVRYMFYPPGICFIPDTDENDDAIDPPVYSVEDGTGAGMWTNNNIDSADTTFMRYTLGVPVDTSQSFTSGDLARYIGDNYGDGTTGDDALHGDTPYWEHFYVGQRAKQADRWHQAAWQSSMSGAASSGTRYSLTDSEKAWWSVNWYHQSEVEPVRPSNPTIRVDTGTATGGSATTLVDSSKIDDPSNEPACAYWRAARFNGFDSPWQGFILEVDKVDDSDPENPITTTYKLPILTGDDSTGTVTFAAVTGFSVEAGDVYRIKEPAYHLNQWKGRTLVITKPDGEEITLTITHNDHDSLYFDAVSEDIPVGSRYQLLEIQTGGVWQWDGSEWTVPSGEDPRGATFRDDMRCNLPTKAKWYGKVDRGDYVTYPGLYEEIVNAIKELQWTKMAHSWTSRANDAVPEDNLYSAESMGLITGSSIQDALDNALADAFDTGHWSAYDEDIDGPPRTGISADGDDAPTRPPSAPAAAHVLVSGAYAYGKVTGVNTLIPCSIDWYAWATYNVSDTNESEVCIIRPAPPAPTGLPDINSSVKFNDGGTGLQFRKWSLHDTTGSASDATRKSAKLDVDIPPSGNHNFSKVCASADGYLYTMNQGFYVSAATAILKWDMDGWG